MQNVSAWRESSYSTNGGQNCVEVAAPGTVLVRDTTNRAGGTLDLSPSAWQKFVDGLK